MARTLALVVHPNRTGPAEPVRYRWAVHSIADGTTLDPASLADVVNAGLELTKPDADLVGQAHLMTAARAVGLDELELAGLVRVDATIDYHPPTE